MRVRYDLSLMINLLVYIQHSLTQSRETMAEQSEEVPTQQVDRQQIIKRLCSQGFGLTFETAVTRCKCELVSPTEEEATRANGSEASASATTEQQWQTVDYGIPAVAVESGSLQFRIYDVTTGEMLRRFSLSEDSCYSELSGHFHAFIDCTSLQDADKAYCFGISTPDEAVAKKMLAAVNHTIPHANRSLSELGVPPPKRGRFENEGSDDDWVIIEPEDVLEAQGESAVMDDGGSDDNETDSALVRLRPGMKRRRKSQEKKTRSLVISEPKEFRHIAHVGQDTSVSNMTKAMSVDISQSQDISSMGGSIEPGTEETTSFVEVPQEDLPVAPPAPVPPPPPPIVKPPAPVIIGKKSSSGTGTLKPSQSQNPAISLDEILRTRGTLRPVGGQKVVPEPPPKPDRTKLVSEINTFDRNTLKHIEHKKDKDSTDLDDPNCLQSILRSGLEKMREKLTTDFSNLGIIDSKGDEYGFGDECDGPLFTEE